MTTDPAISLFDQGPPPACPAAFNLAAHTLAPAALTPDKIALEVISDIDTAPERWTFAQIDRAIRGTMTGLAQAGVQPSDRVLLRIGHSIDFPILFFAAAGMGALPVPTAAALTPPEVATAIGITRPTLIAGAPALVPSGHAAIGPEIYRNWQHLPPADYATTRADDPAYIVFTSGTGGTPKGVVHAHRAGWARRMMWRDWYDLRADDRLLHAGAFNWTFTLGTGLTDPWAAGATALIYAGPADKGIWSALAARHAPTIFAGAPGVFRQLLASGTVTAQAFAALRHALSAGDAMPDRIRAAWEQATGKPVLNALGMSEVSTYASQSPRHPTLRPQLGRRVAVLREDGRIAPAGTPGLLAVSSRDPGLMLGYLQNGTPQLPLTGEWFVTGDIARMDATGALTHEGRSGDILNAQGYRVSAAEVEAALLAHEGVAEAAVLAVEVRADVEVIAAFVVPADGAAAQDSVTAETLLEHCQSRLARYKCPRIVTIVPSLPRTPTGKVLKRQLKARFHTGDSP